MDLLGIVPRKGALKQLGPTLNKLIKINPKKLTVKKRSKNDKKR
jgi:hypothetical protein